MKAIFFIIISFLFHPGAYATVSVPKNFLFYKDMLIKTMQTGWHDITMPSVVPGLIEQETCYTLTHPKCWSRFSELKTDREYGFGLGQLTITAKFSAFDEVKKLDARLKDWKFEDRFNAEKQILAILVMLKRNYAIFKSETELDRYAFALAAYNGGIGGIIADQRICKHTRGCNPNLWFGHVEHTSLKKKVKVQGYGKSFFEINREYPQKILLVRRFKYKSYIDIHFTKTLL